MGKHIILSSLIIAGAAFPALAQYDQNIAVEGRYIPEYIRHDRIGVFPRPVKFGVQTDPLDYTLQGVAANFMPQAIPLPATSWRASRIPDSSRGYVELGLGSWLNSTLSAGYRFIDSPSTTLGVRLQHNSTSLWKPDRITPVAAERKMERYDESLGIYARHRFDGAGTLDAAIDWHIGNFNYYATMPLFISAPDGSIGAPTQTLNDLAARVAWHSPSAQDNINWNAFAGVRYFGYRSLYIPEASAADGLTRLTGGRETDVNLGGAFSFPTSSLSSLGIDLDAHILAYSDYKNEALGYSIESPDTYGLISLTPYYRFRRSRLNISVGAKIDFSFNAGVKGDRYSVFHIAPQLKADYNAGAATLFLHLLGGSELHTLAGGWQYDYYQMPGLMSTRPTYTPLDGRLGASFGPFSGFEAGFDVAYRMSKDAYCGGWYQGWLNLDAATAPGLTPDVDGSPVRYSYDPESRMDLHGFSVGVHASYDMGRWLKINAEGRYQPQKGKTGYFNGYDRPRWTLDLSAETNPWSSLRFKLAYQYRGVRAIPVEGFFIGSDGVEQSLREMYRLPDLCYLNLGASYDITKSISVWLQGDNLLNRHDEGLPFLSTPGVTVTAGVQWIF